MLTGEDRRTENVPAGQGEGADRGRKYDAYRWQAPEERILPCQAAMLQRQERAHLRPHAPR